MQTKGTPIVKSVARRARAALSAAAELKTFLPPFIFVLVLVPNGIVRWVLVVPTRVAEALDAFRSRIAGGGGAE